MPTQQRTRFTEEERESVDRLISLVQTDGASGSVSVDRDFLLEDGNADLFFLHYFPSDFCYIDQRGKERPNFEPFDYEFIDILENDNRSVIWSPARHGKSTVIRRWFVYVMCREPQISIMYIEKTDPTVRAVARAMLNMLETNKLLVNDFGEFRSNHWSTEAFTIKQRPEYCEWPTLAFYSAGGSAALGKACNICVVDDPVTSDNSSSPLERDRLERWWDDQPATAPTPLPIKNLRYLRKLFLDGTPFHMDDLFHRVVSKGGFKHYHLKAVDDKTGECLAPMRYCYRDTEELKRSAETNPADAVLLKRIDMGAVVNLLQWRKDHTTAAFLRRYQGEIVDPDAQRFPRVWFDGGEDEMAPPGGYPGCLEPEESFGMQRKDGWTYITGVDPAAGTQGPHTVRFACVTLACNLREDQNTIKVVDADFGQQPMLSDNPKKQSQVDIVLDHVARYNSRVVLESNNVQGVWAQAIRKEARERGMMVNITGHFTTSVKKSDEELGVEAMAPMVENGYFRLPYESATDKRKAESLMEEFVFKGVIGTDDILMATWFAWRVLERSKRSAIHQRADERYVPPYRDVGDKWDYPADWTKKDVAVFHNMKPEEVEHEQVC